MSPCVVVEIEEREDAVEVEDEVEVEDVEEVEGEDEDEVEVQALDLQLAEAELHPQLLFLKVLKEGGRKKMLQACDTSTRKILAHRQLSLAMLLPLSFSAEVWDLLVTETNRYAAENLSSSARARPWHDVTVEEMKAFLGMLIIMGIIVLPRLEMYWSSTHPLIATPGIASVMPLVRFEQIYRFLHLNDSSQQVPSGSPRHDKLFKLRKLLDLVTPRFESEYVLHKEVTIDEAMIPFKGRLGFNQYMKDKPTKWGIKVFTLCDATNGYVYRLQIYTGKNLEETSISAGLYSQVVLDLMKGFEMEGHELYTDNYYTSPQLYQTLYKKGINACGTARTNRRDFPKELVQQRKAHDRGFYDYRSNGPLLAVVWMDRRYIYFVSTIHKAQAYEQTTVKRRQADGTQIDVNCPPLLPDYQQFMRGVDKSDQMISCYNVGRRSKKWWKRGFSHIVECSILNAYILDCDLHPLQHSLCGRNKRDYLAFRLQLAEELIGGFTSRKRAGRPRSGDHLDCQRLTPDIGHWPQYCEKIRDCVVCSKKKAKFGSPRHETHMKCSHCDVHLCVNRCRDCFQKYHTLVEYWH